MSAKGKTATKGAASKVAAKGKSKASPLFPARPKNLRVGGDIAVPTEVSRFVKWPKNVRLQRQRKILAQRLKCPPVINQFKQPLDSAEALPLFKLLSKYKPETAAEKKIRLAAAAKDKADGKDVKAGAKPMVLKYGLNHITYLVEQKKAKLVVLASDVDPIELVLWMPALCRKMGVPYVIVNNKGRLGALVEKKTAAAVAFVDLRQEDNDALNKIVETANIKFANNSEQRKKWGGGVMGLKTIRKLEKRKRMLDAEAAKKAML